MKRFQLIKYVLLPLIIGWILYQFRPFGNGWIDALKIRNEKITNLHNILPDFCTYNLADGLWAFALTSLILIIWQNNASKNREVWLLIVFIYVIAVELLQKFKILAGTFDWLDLIFNISGFLCAILIFKKYEKFTK